MMARRGFLASLGGGFPALLGGCGVFGSTYRYRYKMTVEVDTPEGLRSGSAVHEQIVSKSNIDLGDLSAKRGMRTRGEAVAVDLAGGQTLFALIPESEVAQAALDPQWNNDWVDSAQRIRDVETPQGPLALRPEKAADRFAKSTGYPKLVRFRAIDNPASVEEVDPANLANSFHPGYRLKGITVQVTDDPVTTGIEERFAWRDYYRDRHFDGTATIIEDMTDPKLAAHLTSGSFSTELDK